MIIKNYESFLINLGYLPLSNWKSGNVQHQIQKLKGERKPPERERILNEFSRESGVYMYSYNDKCLYVGEANDIGCRLAGHYDAAWLPQEGRQKKYPQYDFFKLYRYELEVKWIEVQNEFDRDAVEAMCTRIFNPIYIEFRRKYRGN
ncbi:hypothetical protein ACSVDE_10990 [Pseudalkalibacillus sp. Hm43]|uniref:hypothetical protein n=1 Tax=Pseudalkalibacillus sp. Hm43 TaxID=3450742 RepID=UPI003F42ECD0